jgi:hypothetical protein
MNDIVDMSHFVEAKSDQLNADDLIGAPRTITVRRVAGSDGEQPVSIFYEGDNNKPFKPCKTMRRILLAIWGKYASDYVGRSMTLYRDDKVTFGGLDVGGIRISHMSHIDKETVVVVMKTKGKKAGIKILPLAQQEQRGQRGASRQSPEAWAAEHIASAMNTPTLDAFESAILRAANAVAKLQRDHPDLHQQVLAAYEQRRAEFPDWQEGKPDSELGEGFVDRYAGE